jgi:hypothetical protein
MILCLPRGGRLRTRNAPPRTAWGMATRIPGPRISFAAGYGFVRLPPQVSLPNNYEAAPRELISRPPKGARYLFAAHLFLDCRASHHFFKDWGLSPER